jgi:tetratricopeptide (TPR) repeat protein
LINETPGFPPQFPLFGVLVPKEALAEYFVVVSFRSSSPDSGLIRRSVDQWHDRLTEAFGRDTASINAIVRGIEDGTAVPSPYLAGYLGSRDTTVLLRLLDVTGPDDWLSGRAQMAVARGDTAGARTLLAEEFPETPIESAVEFLEMFAWADLLARLDDPEAALAAYQRLDSVRSSFGPDTQEDPLLLIRSWAERGALYQQLGQTAEAIEMYQKLIDAWRDGDEHVQPSVERARRAVQLLRGEVEVGEPE